MVVVKENFSSVPQLVANDGFDPKLIAHPNRHRVDERSDAARKLIEISENEALKFRERFIIENDVVEVADLNATLAQAVADGMNGKIFVVLFAREAFFLGRGDELAIAHECGRRIMVEG
jgi:hypothetical protein